MMRIAIPRETESGERRAALVPDSVKKLVRLGAEVKVEQGLGSAAGFSDEEYGEAGAQVLSDRATLLGAADMVLRVRKPSIDDLALLKPGCIHASFLDPFNETDLIDAMCERDVSAISMEMIPRSTRSQKMDALSSQANLAGYVMVLKAASYLPSILPMMMTPAGTLKPAKVFVIGAGVAGLQAIATAKRLGAQVTAFDTRSEVAEQVQSVGAKFLEIDLGETGSTKDGYARELTPEQLEIQREAQRSVIANSDVVITTAQVFGRKPPVIVPREFVAGMRAGSVVIDMAAETGGNVEGSVPGEVVEINGVNVVGTGNWSNEVARDASQMYSSNLFNLVEEFWDAEQNRVVLDFENDLVGCVVTHGKAIVNEVIANSRNSN
ncbi:MAG: NAD(P) transhydrogenase subunit alpha [Pseudomonadales bacterium]|nr:NAD(P) transhydrogenase subunit alpha [Pseudomonadales bacterium]NNM12064.1 NAD(P) transhydrogenase subunit alpha [Pseudomonadales bacterium]RZV59983.1 MAG: NAD(P) transhydrogenase subunit alpha [Pseudomonadales bacterium]